MIERTSFTQLCLQIDIIYRFHGRVGVCEEVLCADEQDLISRKNIQPANDVEIVETESKTRSFAGNLRSIANT